MMSMHAHAYAYLARHVSTVRCKCQDAGAPSASWKSEELQLKLEVGRARVEVGRTRVEVGRAGVEVSREKRVTLLGHGNKMNGCFCIPKKQNECHKLRVNEATVTDPADLHQAWVNHFDLFGQSQANKHPSVKLLESELTHLEARSRTNQDFILDTDISIEEVEAAVKSLKLGKSGSADKLNPEHLKYGGHTLHSWLLRIFTAVVHIPPSLKLGVIIPIYKGKGRDLLNPNSYRGITLTSVISKCLERIILNRMELPLKEGGFPHVSQTAYQHSLSCSDAIFSTQEALLKFVREGDKAYLCLYDLEKAFDSIEFATLLSHLFKHGINERCWRLIKSWYTNAKSVVKHGGKLSHPFCVSRGVRQGSVLSPMLFLIVMDTLLYQLHLSGHGLSMNGLTISSAAHADDIRSVNTTIDDLQSQGKLIEQFVQNNAVKLNTSKTELVSFSTRGFHPEDIQLAGQSIATQPTAKCLGYWWHTNFSPVKSIQENICKARTAYFALGSIGAYQGLLNPLSGRSLFTTFVLPILLYGSDNWILTEQLLMTLEKFQAEIGRRILRLSKSHSDVSVLIGLHWPRIRVHVLLRKLAFLVKLL